MTTLRNPIAMILFVPLIAQGIGLFATYFPSPTGRNALEDYVRATDVVASPSFAPYIQWSVGKADPDDAPAVRVSIPSARRLAADGPGSPRQRLRDERATIIEGTGHWDTYLDYCAEVTERFGGVLDLIHAGNAKPLQRSTDLSDLRTQFASLTNVALAAAHLRFSQGRSKEGTAILLDQLGFLDNLERGEASYVPTLEGERAILTAFARHVDEMSLPECEGVSASVTRLLARPLAALDAQSLRRAVWEANLRADVAEVVRPGYDPKQRYASPLSPVLVEQLRAMSAPIRMQAVEDALSSAIDAVARTAKTLTGPEAGWDLPKSAPSDPSRQWDDIPTYFLQRAKMDAFPLLSYEIDFRTRLRLLALSGQVRAYRFRRGRYPRSLSELGKGVAVDPLNGLEYGFQRSGPSFEVSSRGLPGGKPIYLDPAHKQESSSVTP